MHKFKIPYTYEKLLITGNAVKIPNTPISMEELLQFMHEILEEVLIEQAGRDLFQKEEALRLLISHFLAQNDWRSIADYEKEFAALNENDRHKILKSMILWFELANLVETTFRKSISLEEIQQNDLNLQSTIKYSKTKITNAIDLIGLMHKSQLQLTFSPHPLNKRKPSILNLLKNIYTRLEEFPSCKPFPLMTEILRSKIKSELTVLWGTNESRPIRYHEFDRLRNSLFYFENSIVDTISLIYNKILQSMQFQLKQHKVDYNLPIFFEFSYLLRAIGYKKNPDLPTLTLLMQKRLMLRRYIDDIKKMLKDLPISSRYFEFSNELAKSLEEDEFLFPEFTALTEDLNIDEPIRRKLDFIRLKLENSLAQVNSHIDRLGLDQTMVGYNPFFVSVPNGPRYNRSQEFLEDLQIIYRTLKKSRGKIIAKTHFHPLMEKVRIFGFHMAPLDIVVDVNDLHNLFSELFELNGFSYQDMETSEKEKLLLNELSSLRPLGADLFYQSNLLSLRASHSLNFFKKLRNSLDTVSPRSIQSIILHNYSSYVDYLEAMLICKEVGILKMAATNKIATMAIDIIPSLQTDKNLINIPHEIGLLAKHTSYFQLLQKRKKIQPLFLDFSTLIKDVSYLKTYYLILELHNSLYHLSKKTKIKFRIVHGRGSPLGRGGIPSSEAIENLPGMIHAVQILEAGEAIPSKYFDKTIAWYNLETVVSSWLKKRILGHKPFDRTVESKIESLLFLSEKCQEKYNELLDNEDFRQFFVDCTPVDEIDMFLFNNPVSSIEKIKRGLPLSSIDTLSWNLAWNVSRINLSSFYGVGTALQTYSETYGIDLLKSLYQNWGYFKVIIDNLQMSLLKTNMRIGPYYASHGDNNAKAIMHLIQKEYDLTCAMVLQITGQNELLEASFLRKTVLKRLENLDPLSIVHASLWNDWRLQGRSKDRSNNNIILCLEESVNVITTGLRNIG